MLTNPFETQMVKSLGVKVGGRTAPPAPFENLRATMAGARPDAFAGEGDRGEGAGPGCPFAAALSDATTAAAPGIRWDPAAEARLERIPSFIRTMARRSIERFAEDKGYAAITEAVMDEARSVFGM
jgi:hypothetical protein